MLLFDEPQPKQLKRWSQLITVLSANYVLDIVSSSLNIPSQLVHSCDRYCNFSLK